MSKSRKLLQFSAIVGLVAASLGFTESSAFADGGVLLARGAAKDLDVSVFAFPAPLRAGPVDVSVLVQRSGSGEPVLDAQVEVSWSAGKNATAAWMPPCCTMEMGSIISAARSHSKNKMLYSAVVPVKSSGPSTFTVRVAHEEKVVSVPCAIVAGPPRPALLAYWPCLAFPPFAIAGFVLHQRLVGRRPGRKPG